jgi:hypothetical protein
MTTTCNGNINPLYNSYFSLKFKRGTDQFELLCQRANLPGIKVPDLVQPTTLGTVVPVPSLSAVFDPLTVEFIVDENMQNWNSIYAWIRNITNIENDSDYNLDYDDWHIQATLSIFTKPYSIDACESPITIKFNHVVPVALSGLNFQSDNTDTVIQKASATFKYSYYTISPNPENIIP